MKVKSVVSVLILGMLMLSTFGAYANVTLDEIDEAVVRTQENPEARKALELDCIAIVESEEATFTERYQALRILAVVGSEACIQPLAALLDDPERAHLVRNVLEKLPYDEVDMVLLDGLARTTGNMRLGIISTIGHRQSASAVEALGALLAHEELETASAAALALGRIGTLDALMALVSYYTTADRVELNRDLAEAALAAAANLVENDAIEPAVFVYSSLLSTDWPDFIRAGAFNGLLSALPEDAPGIVYDTIHGDDPLLGVVAIAAVTTLEGEQLTERLAEDLDILPVELQALMLDAFAERNDPAALPVVHASLKSDDANVRMAAMKAVSVIGDTSSIEALGGILAFTSDRQERLAAIESLRRINAPGLNERLIAYMNEVETGVRPDIMEVLVQRAVVEAIDPIIDQIAQQDVRAAAFRALGLLAGPEHLPRLLELLSELEGNTGRNDAVNAVVALCNRIAEASSEVEIIEAVYGDLPDGEQSNITHLVARQVRQGRDAILASNNIAGDPAPGIVKQLRIDYTVDGVPGSRTVSEGESLSLSVGMSTPALVEAIAASIQAAPSTDAHVSLLRVLSRLGGQSAFDVVASYAGDDNADVHDGAVRALADWPDVLAVGALVDVFGDSEETAHRMLSLRGAVRLLRMGGHSTDDAIRYYELLAANATTDDERMLIVSGLAEIADPAALRLVAPYLNDGNIQAEADIAFRRIAEALELNPEQALADYAVSEENNAEFKPIFNGENLEGWHGDPALWRVEDGVIIGETTEDSALEHNTFLVRDVVESDFELKFRYRIDSTEANSGVQIRSEEFEQYRVRGYQPDIATTDWITGICYEEGGRGILARRGQQVHLNSDGESEVLQFAEEAELGTHINMDDWNEYHIIAQGNRFITFLNGHKMHEIVDDAPQAKASGIIAFQLHTGPPMKLRFTDIMLKQLVD